MHNGNITKNLELPDSVLVQLWTSILFLATLFPLDSMWGTGDAATSESDAFIIRELRKYYERKERAG